VRIEVNSNEPNPSTLYGKVLQYNPCLDLGQPKRKTIGVYSLWLWVGTWGPPVESCVSKWTSAYQNLELQQYFSYKTNHQNYVCEAGPMMRFKSLDDCSTLSPSLAHLESEYIILFCKRENFWPHLCEELESEDKLLCGFWTMRIQMNTGCIFRVCSTLFVVAQLENVTF